MASYVAAYNGYIADVPEIWFKRCDGRVFHYDQLSSCSMNIQQNTIDVNAGQDLFPVATLPGTSTFQMTCTLANFDTSLFELSEALDFADNASYEEYFTETVAINGTTHKATLTHLAVANSIYINGLEEAQSASAGKYVVDNTGTTTVITFHTDESGDVVVSGRELKTVKEIVVDNKSSAIGSVIAMYPVYASGEDCTASGISGKVFVKVYRVRVTGHPSIGGQYKSASTFEITFSAIKNTSSEGSGKAYSIAYRAV